MKNAQAKSLEAVTHIHTQDNLIKEKVINVNTLYLCYFAYQSK